MGRSRREPKLSPEQREQIRDWAAEHKRASIPDLQAMVKDKFQGLQVSTTTLYNILRERPSWVPLMLFFRDDERRPAAKATLLRLIKSARKSIDICTYIFSSEELCDAVINLSKAGVTVRLISDGSEAEKLSSKVSTLRAENVSVRLGPRNARMGINLAIIDKNCLITGSMDWSDQGLNFNGESVEFYYYHEAEDRHTTYTNMFKEMWDENAARSQ